MCELSYPNNEEKGDVRAERSQNPLEISAPSHLGISAIDARLTHFAHIILKSNMRKA